MALEREGFDEYGHRYKIERTNPEGDARRLALRLGSAIDSEAVNTRNAEFYMKEATRWDDKAVKWSELLDRIHARDRGEVVVSASRMDPMKTYEASAVADQITKMRATAAKFRSDAQESMGKAQTNREELDTVQRQLAELR